MGIEVVVAKAELQQLANGQWLWRTLGGNGEVVGWGEQYRDVRDADAALRAHLVDPDTPVERLALGGRI